MWAGRKRGGNRRPSSSGGSRSYSSSSSSSSNSDLDYAMMVTIPERVEAALGRFGGVFVDWCSGYVDSSDSMTLNIEISYNPDYTVFRGDDFMRIVKDILRDIPEARYVDININLDVSVR